ncbi:hypothetical protein BT96DRAFT_398459 [Gymnopus androsaceus JB14]|uniref:Uncharacterized protein n=1 Tax=Gymnopus androsaceus JB14 TaxID=1447944 RepID=A0A6A4I7Y1_9AGAR|nr:hypothetical protein BT96DRAFT_398459 [Gymnopus androsaceus JB14]
MSGADHLIPDYLEQHSLLDNQSSYEDAFARNRLNAIPDSPTERVQLLALIQATRRNHQKYSNNDIRFDIAKTLEYHESLLSPFENCPKK